MRATLTRLGRLAGKALPVAGAVGVGALVVQQYTTEQPEQPPRVSALAAALDSSHKSRHGQSLLPSTASTDNATPATTDERPIPEHLTVGSRVQHATRGLGIVVKLESLPSAARRAFVAFDDGDIHGYPEQSWVKLSPAGLPLASLRRSETGELPIAEQSFIFAGKEDHRKVPEWIHSKHVEDICTLLNALIDLDMGFSEAVEQRVFRSAVLTVCERLEGLLPAPYLALCFGHSLKEGIQPHDADELVERVTTALHHRHENNAVALPYLKASQEWQVLAFVVTVLVGSMTKGVGIDDMLAAECAGPVVMEVFIKGSAGTFLSERDTLVSRLTAELDSVPLLPSSLKQRVCTAAVELVCETLEEAMVSAYTDTISTIDAALDEADAHMRESARRRREGEGAAAVAECRRASDAAEARAAAAAATPFNKVVRAELVTHLARRLPVPEAAQYAVERHVGPKVCKMLSSTFNVAQMNAAAAYVYDQHRLARRLRSAPPSTRGLMLRKKEEIVRELVRMETHDNVLSARELARGLRRLGLHVQRSDVRELFAALDRDGDGVVTTSEVEVCILGRELTQEERRQMSKAPP